jgi:hypothetical protein
MFRAFWQHLKTRLLITFALIHLGLILAVFSLGSLPLHDRTHQLLATGIALLYGGVLFGSWSVVGSVLSLARKARQFSTWSHWILNELPKFLAALPELVAASRKAIEEITQTHVPEQSPPRKSRSQKAA